MVCAILSSLSKCARRFCVSRSCFFRASALAPSAVAAFLRRSSDCAFRESRVVKPERECVSIGLRDSAARCSSSSTCGCRPLFSRAISARSCSVALRLLRVEMTMNSGEGNQPQKRRNQPEVSSADCTTAQRFHCNIRIAFPLDCVLEDGNQFFLRLTLPKLCSNSCGKFHGVERKRNDIICTKIERAGSLQSPSVDNHFDFD